MAAGATEEWSAAQMDDDGRRKRLTRPPVLPQKIAPQSTLTGELDRESKPFRLARCCYFPDLSRVVLHTQ